jgi:hypothetical protein
MTEGVRAFLNDEPMPEMGELGHDDYVGLRFFDSIIVGYKQNVRLSDIWEEHRDAILADWLSSRPGSRPKCWWKFDAPEHARKRFESGENQRKILRDLTREADENGNLTGMRQR